MFISISKTGNERYIFCVGDNPTEESGSWLVSYRDAALLGDLPATFNSFGEAHSAASRLIEERSACVLAKRAMFYSQSQSKLEEKELAEGSVVSHYIEQVGIIGQRIATLSKTQIKDFDIEIGILSNEVSAIKEEVIKLTPLADGHGKATFEAIKERLEDFSNRISKLQNTKQKSANKKISNYNAMRKSVVRAFSEAAMQVLQPIHKDVFVKGAIFYPDDESCEAILATPQYDLVSLSFDKNLLLSGISACGQIRKFCGGEQSNSFFLKYWEPIVNAVGHFHSKGNNMVAVAGMDMSRREIMKAFSSIDASDNLLEIVRPVVMGNRTWILKKTSESVTTTPDEGIKINDEVECVAKKLPSYFGRTGTVDQISSPTGKILYRVNFRRGLGALWTDGNNIKKVNLGVQPENK